MAWLERVPRRDLLDEYLLSDLEMPTQVSPEMAELKRALGVGGG